MFFVSEIETASVECTRQLRHAVVEERGSFNLVLVAEFAQEQHSEIRRSRLKRPFVKNSVRFESDHGEQPMALVIHLNHRLVDRDVIRLDVAFRLYVGFLHPVVDDRSTPPDTQTIEYLLCI